MKRDSSEAALAILRKHQPDVTFYGKTTLTFPGGATWLIDVVTADGTEGIAVIDMGEKKHVTIIPNTSVFQFWLMRHIEKEYTHYVS